jgi:SAM-dependent methyltransferase
MKQGFELRKRVSDVLYQLGPGRYYQPAYQHIAQAIGLSSGSFLDVGCGPGWLCLHVAADRLDIDAIGIDHSHRMVEAARRNKGTRLNITIREMSAIAIKFPEATFDVAAAVQSAHHWDDPEPILAEVLRVLKPGGRFLLYEADKDRSSIPHGWIRRSRGWPPDMVVLNGWRRFGMNEAEWTALEVVVRGVGFSNVVVGEHGFYRTMVLTK